MSERLESGPLNILYRDNDLVVIDKPAGLLVHRSLIDQQETRYALQIIRDQINSYVYPVHRLDKATSGALIFALNSQSATQLSQSFAEGRVKKTYLAIIRGFTHDQTIDHPLKELLDKKADPRARADKPAQSAVTHVEPLEHFEVAMQVDRYPHSRYSLVQLTPQTGRKHQLRRHLSHIRHPIVGDSTHGVGRHNRFFAEHFGVRRLFLCCTQLTFCHPVTGASLTVKAGLDQDFSEVLEALRCQNVISL